MFLTILFCSFFFFPFLVPWLCSPSCLSLLPFLPGKHTKQENIRRLLWRNIHANRGDSGSEKGRLWRVTSKQELLFLCRFVHGQRISLFPALLGLRLCHFRQDTAHQGSRNHCAAALMLSFDLWPEPQWGWDNFLTRDVCHSGMGLWPPDITQKCWDVSLCQRVRGDDDLD